jgi:hypothetical protein
MNWQRVKHGYICERIIGFSLPINGEVAVISYEGIHIVPLANPDSLSHHPEFAEGGNVYDADRHRLDFAGHNFCVLGLYGGQPRLCSSHGERISFDDGDVFTVSDANGRETFAHPYTDMSGDWRVVTFTPDDEYILFGIPYELEIFRRDR